MTSPKRTATASHALSDVRLARAFGFSADDLAANQSGFLSAKQAQRLPAWLQRPSSWLSRWLPTRQKTSYVARVVSICGQADVQQNLHEVHGGRYQISYRRLSLTGCDVSFRIDPAQVRAIESGARYRVYTEAGSTRILSLERVTGPC